LERADAEHFACYLETENERNVEFYLKQGFDMIVNGEKFGTSGVKFWTFSRTAKKNVPMSRALTKSTERLPAVDIASFCDGLETRTAPVPRWTGRAPSSGFST
jgi:hypothetical protein